MFKVVASLSSTASVIKTSVSYVLDPSIMQAAVRRNVTACNLWVIAGVECPSCGLQLQHGDGWLSVPRQPTVGLGLRGPKGRGTTLCFSSPRPRLQRRDPAHRQPAPLCSHQRPARNSASGRGKPPSYSMIAARSSKASSRSVRILRAGACCCGNCGICGKLPVWAIGRSLSSLQGSTAGKISSAFSKHARTRAIPAGVMSEPQDEQPASMFDCWHRQ